MTAQWQLQPIFGSFALVFALAVLMLLVLWVGPAFGSLSVRQRRTLLAIRGLLMLLLLFAMLRPARVTSEKRVQTAQLLVLFDASRSMGYRDGDGGLTRWEQQQALLKKTAPKLAGMGDHFAVDLLAFSAQIQPQQMTDGVLQIAARPIGEETDLGSAISGALQRHAGKRIAAMVLIGDGAQRAVLPDAPPQQAARQLNRRATPLYTITIGRSRDQTQARDVAIENLQDQYSVFVKNEFQLRVGVRVQGYVQQPIAVSLLVEDEAGEVATIGPQEVVASQDSQVVSTDFVYRPEKAGQYRLRVKAADQPGELTDNNEMAAFLEVREGGLRVLLLTSGLQQEQKFIRRALGESGDIELDYQPISLISRPQWPLDLESMVRIEDYDVILIGELDATALQASSWEQIAKLVEQGRGLMMYGGYHSFGPGGYDATALTDVLPVKMDRFARQSLDPSAPIRTDQHVPGPLIMLPTGNSSVTHLAPESANLEFWKSLKPLLGANKFDSTQLSDNSVVLASSQNGDPLLVQGGYVSGRVLAFAGDSTYRWWRYGQQDAHKKFWRQAILWLARRDKQEANSVWLQLPQRRFRAKSRVAFETGMTDEQGDTVVGAVLDATLTRPDGTTAKVGLGSSPSGQQGIVAETEQAGIYRITVTAVGEEVQPGYADFVVLKEDFELSDPAANPGLMDQLAKITARVGGQAIAPEQLAGLLDTIKASPPQDEVETQSKWQIGDTAPDAWFFFLLLVLLLGAEWFCRKRWGLV